MGTWAPTEQQKLNHMQQREGAYLLYFPSCHSSQRACGRQPAGQAFWVGRAAGKDPSG